MLTPNQEKYLATIPKYKIISIKPFDPEVKNVARNLISKVKKVLSDAEVVFLGAAALGIAGQNDIDMTILANGKWGEFSQALKELFGEPTTSNQTLIKWEFIQDGFEVELYLGDRISSSLQEQIDTFNLLKANPKLRAEYEKIKWEANWLPFREYMRIKYEFFNKILG